ncbi:type IV toxin-antitoxin system AbiEi family antitoxin domain-containing protein [Saccharopolyspora halophila]|uniref:Type IV toxin-antitoxin system AbiEi family antitoxin domain-containing protein n=1 Tax=Saccharopolyspora halophila TaxID=405551 RepID=A0ABP5SJX3_9PSEU
MSIDRRDLRRRLFELASAQGGYFTSSQAKELGYSHQAQAYHVKAGNWRRIERGMYRLTEWIPGTHDELARWTLWSRGRGVVSHESALSAHGIGEFESAYVHLTVPPGFTMRSDAVALHRTELPADDVSERLGYRVTTPVRTIIDIAAQAPDEEQLARVISDARRAGLITHRRLRSRSEIVAPKAALHIERAIQQETP